MTDMFTPFGGFEFLPFTSVHRIKVTARLRGEELKRQARKAEHAARTKPKESGIPYTIILVDGTIYDNSMSGKIERRSNRTTQQYTLPSGTKRRHRASFNIKKEAPRSHDACKTKARA